MNRIVKIFFLIIGMPVFGYSQDTLKQIEFTKTARGFREHLIITQDSVSIRIEDARSYNPLKVNSGKTKAEDWAQLNNLIKSISLSDVPTLKSPTMKRTYDGALHGRLVFITKRGNSYSHVFDDEEPHPMLNEIMDSIRKIRDHTML